MKSIVIYSLLLLMSALLSVAGGCSSSEVKIPSVYGGRNGYETIGSVNGTHVLGELFRQAGYTVRSTERLSPRIQESDVIVWAPDSFAAPTKEVQTYLEDWLMSGTGRTLIYIDRDFDAAIEYWDAMQQNASPADQLIAQREQGMAVHDFDKRSAESSNEVDCEWFSIQRDLPIRRPRQLSGDWAEMVDAGKTDIVLRSRISLPTDWESDALPNLADRFPYSENLLSTADGKDPIVIRYSDEDEDGMQLILISNGSFLLNQPLVNHEHRKLAAALVQQCGYGELVTFLETNDAGVKIVNSSDVAQGRSGWEWLTVWPISALGIHIGILLIVFCFASFPIFGRPKQLPETRSSDFQKHIGALGELLEATDDYDYAQLRVRQYQQIARGETVYRRVGRARIKP